MRIAVIPARGGSKRIPRKNIKHFGGMPMIAWSIRAAVASQCFDRIIVSTDDHEIAQISQAFGAETPFVRPPELSDDHTGTIPVVAHAVAWHNANEKEASDVCCIYATAPFIQANDLRRGLAILQGSGADYAFSVTSYAFPIQRAIRISPEQRVQMIQPEHFQTRSQDLEEACHDAGQFYWGHAHAWLNQRPLFTEAAAPVTIPRYRVQDIDTPEDWERAEWMLKSINLFNKDNHDIQD
ncbi:MAG: pseudaminic acid cytidylyltransferase [Burkholderiales bacterium 35-55-47]|jgi:N-acylneuraminate cytidylyltransferase|uniref:pseudaminic acid cytidylyltransferase n=1 Tax=Limnohabitans sp. TaxID=1907725 RepID=UPI000BCCD5A7|nr:pseudaminic acid cytidylyltransferase [Limnohabitans sp.]OYY18126.1 MAG: pseudaminic acid cytidylyltransferase [Burkholderiales bacterium 35-55-47]OYZ72539.1 MAG: pseudaminic acid cytidylyltransferase [Burkholderiales bacterium 24-55-52]OZA99971.1 MAG: pseudaminic acid cytidylyltransferase [Burkholderiales bacterium 39-55-53]HQR87066.1 pseudaminic acid cytidylyltransferase [Limnohabitans sp.]HQS26836.1 pseudaminic acid cytidylyltransferase [Limnohabitans sp.]